MFKKLFSMIRRLIFRTLIVLLLAVSPVVFPALLLWEGGRVSWRDLAEMYGSTFRVLVRGFP